MDEVLYKGYASILQKIGASQTAVEPDRIRQEREAHDMMQAIIVQKMADRLNDALNKNGATNADLIK